MKLFRPYGFVALFAAVAFATFGGVQTSYAAAKGTCPSQTSIFGTIDSVRGHDIYVNQSGLNGFAHISAAGANVRTNGLALQRNTYVGAFGCFSPKDRVFHASEITLAHSAADYPDSKHQTQTISGSVVAVAPGRIQVQTGPAHGIVTIDTSYTAKVGDHVVATGFFNTDRTFSASSVRVASTTGDPGSAAPIALSGVVDEVHADGFSLSTHADVGHIRIYMTQARRYGPEAKIGAHACVYGTFTADRRAINAQAVIVSYEEPAT